MTATTTVTASSTCELQLPRRALHSINDAAGLDLVCREGSVWITLDEDQKDYVIEAGETFTTKEHRRAVVYALETSRVAIERTRYSKKSTIETFNKFQPMPLMNAAR
ncbi:DUF2917 domain-containing protein [Caenimonas koreensis]|nr:DUF2917 domain-containing protein [Caenimonas koreensis]